MENELYQEESALPLEKELLIAGVIEEKQSLYYYLINKVNHKILYLSRRAQRLFPDAKIGKVCYKALRKRDSVCVLCPLKKEFDGNVEEYDVESNVWINSEATDLPLDAGETGSLVCVMDMTAYRRRVTLTDRLTGLSTYSQFERDMEMMLQNQDSSKFVVIYVDFDKFKYINDRYGFQFGNDVLVSFARMIEGLLNSGELVCRYNSDQFILLLSEEGEVPFEARLLRMYEVIEEWKTRTFPGAPIRLISGIYYLRDGEMEVPTFIDNANMARKSIKGCHGRHYAVYDASLHKRITREKEIELHMVEAIQQKEFFLHIQPKIDLKTEQIIGGEALVRWNYKNMFVMPPGDFIPLFERNGFIKKLDYYVCDQVFGLMRNWIQKGRPIVPISLNISRAFLRDAGFIGKIMNLLEQHEIPPQLIELELTEGIFVEEVQDLISTITEVKKMGFKFSIDDFGAGYSSLNLLRHLPIDILKLDKDFFDQASITFKEHTVLQNVIRMAKSLDMTVLSEGVETDAQREFLIKVGCDLVQGFLYYRPMPVDEFERLIDENRLTTEQISEEQI